MITLKINIPESILKIMQIIESNGFESYVVGGAVRDAILGKEPKDYDLATNATPESIINIFNNIEDYKVVETGIKHGTVTVVGKDVSCEITVFRIDGKYSDNRHPDNVIFTSSLYSDLSRRDFTFNAFAYHPNLGLIDNFEGRQHLTEKKICTVGDAFERFNEDSLRMLRAVRFAAQLGFEIDKATLVEIKANAHLIKHVSTERIREELNKILMSKFPATGFNYLCKTRLIVYILPEYIPMINCEQNNPYHVFNVEIHTLMAVMNAPLELVYRLTMLFHDIGKPSQKSTGENGIDHFYKHSVTSAKIAKRVMRRLKYDNETIERVKTLVLHHDSFAMGKINPHRVRKLLNRLGEDVFKDLLHITRADISAQNPEKTIDSYQTLKELERLMNEEIAQNHCYRIKDLAIDGNDVINTLNIKTGKHVGEILQDCLQHVLSNPDANNREFLIRHIKKIGVVKK